MPTIAKKIAAVAAVCAIAALSAQAESPVAAENGIRLSEWGNKPVLPEVESSAPARKAEAESVLPELGEFLSEEWQTLGAGATDTDRLRKALANRATGRADDSLMSFMTSRWESAPGRLANFLTDHAETRLNAMPGIENAALDLTPGEDGNGFGFSASGVGVLHSSASAAFGIQPKIERASEDGILRGSFGAFQRKAIGGAVVGVNAFADFTSHPVRGEASRWRFGADFASPWVDANVQKYVGGLGERYYHGGELHQAYTPHGTAAEIRVHSPDLRWLEGFARFSETEGRGGNADTRTHGFGLAFQPHFGGLSGWRTNAELAGDDLNVALNYAWTLGEGAALPSVSDPFNVYTQLTDPNVEITEANIASYNIKAYEAAALWELFGGDGNVTFHADYDPSQWGDRYELTWLLVPEYLRVEGPDARYCPPPIISVGRIDYHGFSSCNEKLWGGRDTNQALSAGMHVVHFYAQLIAGAPNHIDGGRVEDVDYLRYEILAGFDANLLVSDDHPLYPGYSALDILQEGDGDWAGLTDAELKAKFPLVDPTWEWFVEARHYLLKFAKILKANGGTCVKKTEGFLCDIEAPGWEKYVPELPPEGGLLPVPKVVVAEGYTGEVFRVTATTAYADVDFTYTGLGNSFTATIDGSFQTFSGGIGFGTVFTNGRYHSGDTTVAIVRLTNSALPVGTYEIQVTADFFYHHNDLNVATRVVTVEVVAKQQTIREYANEDGSAEFSEGVLSELVGVSATRTSQIPYLDFSGGKFKAIRNLHLGEELQGNFVVTADNLHGSIELDYRITLSDYRSKEYLRKKYDLDCDTRDSSRVILSPDPALESAIVLAVGSDDPETIEARMKDACAAISYGAQVNQLHNGTSLLNLAIGHYSVPLQRVLLAHGAGTAFPDHSYGLPIHAAAATANEKMGDFLLRLEEIDPEITAKTEKIRPIHSLGVRRDNDPGEPLKFAELLIRHDVDVDGLNKDEQTYLHYVAENGDHRTMDPILADEPDATLESKSAGFLALPRAVDYQREEVIRKLLENRGRIDIDVNQRESKSGRAAIHYAKTRNHVDMLVCARADLDLTIQGTDSGNYRNLTAIQVLGLLQVPVRTDWITYKDNETVLEGLCEAYPHTQGIFKPTPPVVVNP